MGIGTEKRPDGHRPQCRLPRDLWARLYADFYPRIESYFTARRLQRADAEDLAMQVFEELGRSKAPRDPGAYIRVVARNLLARYRRNKAKESAALRKLLAEEAAKDPAGDLSRQRRSEASYRDMLEAVAGTLSRRQRELLRLRFADNLSIEKIAVRLGCSKPAVYKRIYRLRRHVIRGSQEQLRRAPARGRSGRGGPGGHARAGRGPGS